LRAAPSGPSSSGWSRGKRTKTSDAPNRISLEQTLWAADAFAGGIYRLTLELQDL
jgi:hypothetical protein